MMLGKEDRKSMTQTTIPTTPPSHPIAETTFQTQRTASSHHSISALASTFFKIVVDPFLYHISPAPFSLFETHSSVVEPREVKHHQA